MSIGIIGAVNLGSNFARALARKSIPAMISSRRGPNALRELASQIGTSIRPASVTDAAQADIVLTALRWVDLEVAVVWTYNGLSHRAILPVVDIYASNSGHGPAASAIPSLHPCCSPGRSLW